MGLGVLVGLAFLFLPNWFLPFFRGILIHYSFNPGLSTTGILASWSPVVGPRLGWVVSGILGLILLFEWGNTFHKDFRSFLWTTSLTLATIPLLGIPMYPKEYLFLFIPLIIFLSILAERRAWLRHWGVGVVLILVVLPGLWFLSKTFEAGNSYTVPADILMLLLPVLLVIGLYWLRWWFLHNQHVGLEPPP